MNIKIGLLLCLALFAGCQRKVVNPTEESSDSENRSRHSVTVKVNHRIVDASCGECQFGMDGTSCHLAVRFDGKSFYVDGTSLDAHGDAHGGDGMCNCVRQAKVTGEVKDGRFVATSFELLPLKENPNDL